MKALLEQETLEGEALKQLLAPVAIQQGPWRESFVLEQQP
jgi:hypothetical protein